MYYNLALLNLTATTLYPASKLNHTKDILPVASPSAFHLLPLTSASRSFFLPLVPALASRLRLLLATLRYVAWQRHAKVQVILQGVYKCVEADLYSISHLPDWGPVLCVPAEGAEAYRIRTNYETLSYSRWSKRAWTYQEYILSRRVIFFIDNSVFWQCKRATWNLGQALMQDNEDNFAPRHSSSLGLVRLLRDSDFMPIWSVLTMVKSSRMKRTVW